MGWKTSLSSGILNTSQPSWCRCSLWESNAPGLWHSSNALGSLPTACHAATLPSVSLTGMPSLSHHTASQTQHFHSPLWFPLLVPTSDHDLSACCSLSEGQLCLDSIIGQRIAKNKKQSYSLDLSLYGEQIKHRNEKFSISFSFPPDSSLWRGLSDALTMFIACS